VAALLVALPLGIGEEPALGNRGGDHGGDDDDGDQQRELRAVDDPGVEAEQRGDRPERQARAHEERREGGVARRRAPGERIDEGELGHHLRREERRQKPEIREDGAERDVEATLDEEEGGEEGEGDDAQPLLLLAMLFVVATQHETENERGQDGVPIREVG
jgi:hypothetical protein